MFQQNGNNHIYGLIAQTKANALASGSTTSNVPEGTNLYFTSERARSVINALAPVVYSSVTGQVSIPKSTSSDDGYLSKEDWTTFNNKANAFAGYTGTVSVRNGADTGAVSLTFTNGILTGVA